MKFSLFPPRYNPFFSLISPISCHTHTHFSHNSPIFMLKTAFTYTFQRVFHSISALTQRMFQCILARLPVPQRAVSFHVCVPLNAAFSSASTLVFLSVPLFVRLFSCVPLFIASIFRLFVRYFASVRLFYSSEGLFCLLAGLSAVLFVRLSLIFLACFPSCTPSHTLIFTSYLLIFRFARLFFTLTHLFCTPALLFARLYAYLQAYLHAYRTFAR